MKYAFVHSSNVVGSCDEIVPAVLPPDHFVVTLEEGEECDALWTYVPNGTPRFVRPQAVSKPKIWTAFQFLLRFTEQEREGFRTAALTDPKVADFIQLCGAASEVEANHPMTVAGMEYLVEQGLLTQARSYEILGL